MLVQVGEKMLYLVISGLESLDMFCLFLLEKIDVLIV